MSGTDYADRRQLINRNQIAARGFRDEAFLLVPSTFLAIVIATAYSK